MSTPPGCGTADLPRGFIRGVSPPRVVSHGERGVKDLTGNDTSFALGDTLPSKDFFSESVADEGGEVMLWVGIVSDVPYGDAFTTGEAATSPPAGGATPVVPNERL